MTEQEQQLINGLAEQIRNAPAPQIDRDANNLIQHSIGARSDALYILTQTVLVQQMALDQGEGADRRTEAADRAAAANQLPAGVAAAELSRWLPGFELSEFVLRGSASAGATSPALGRRLLRIPSQRRDNWPQA